VTRHNPSFRRVPPLEVPKPSTQLPAERVVDCADCASAYSSRSCCRHSCYCLLQAPFGGCFRRLRIHRNCCFRDTMEAAVRKSHSVPAREPGRTVAGEVAPNNSERVPVQPRDPGLQVQAQGGNPAPVVAREPEYRLELGREPVVVGLQRDRRKPKILPIPSSRERHS